MPACPGRATMLVVWSVASVAGFAAMTASAASITGTATYRERMLLPPDATFEATVEDVARADALAVVIGRVSFMPAGQVPIRFEIPYVESRVEAGHRYAVRARVTRDGQLIFTTTQMHAVLTQGAGTDVGTITMQHVARSVTAVPAVAGRLSLVATYWKLVEIRDAPIEPLPENREPHLVLQPDGVGAGSGGCNRMTGSYQLNGAAIRFDKLASTMMACVDGMTQESVFFKLLADARTWKIEGDQLVLLDESATSLARFIAVDRT